MKRLIINADGYGLTTGINRAVEECVAFGTVKSISVNVNGACAGELAGLIARYPHLSVGCHLNPIVGRPVLPAEAVPSLVDDMGFFFHDRFDFQLLSGRIRPSELEAEMRAQVDLCKTLAGAAFSHVDAHMGKHRLPTFYRIFLDVALWSGAGRIRTHRYRLVPVESGLRFVTLHYYARHPARIATHSCNLWLRRKAASRGLVMPDHGLFLFDGRGPKPNSMDVWIAMLSKVPAGISEFIVHPAYLSEDLGRLSGLLGEREEDFRILTSEVFRNALVGSGITLAGYRDIPLHQSRLAAGAAGA